MSAVGRLPIELVEDVLTWAWIGAPEKLGYKMGNTCADPLVAFLGARQRWSLFHAVSAVSSAWNAVVLSVPFLHVFIQDKLDAMGYRFLLERRRQRDAQDGVDDSSKGYFDRSHLCIDFRGQFALARILPTVTNSYSADLLYGTRDDFEMALEALASHNLSSLRIICAGSYPYAWSLGVNRRTPNDFANLLDVHIRSDNPSWLRSTRSSEDVAAILDMLPNITHLRLTEPILLKDLASRYPKLTHLSLDCLPVHQFGERTNVSSIREWGLGVAIRKGLLRHPGSSKPRIDVYSGVEEPEGWASYRCAISMVSPFIAKPNSRLVMIQSAS
ncbi:hypothetical protein JAAARDRAFT_38672 [Jaapia argillacea MUCL 33604]|uniref:F-box domain-containing protein n=1 Tax=Jaapia argillacea MUCL 33604 TaxID=933084 RepID=A0A067PH06_9AGAM|nr:hypothetical protein JAAARDRAFT_38672 [Jaapia argillacea MUCL 33604]